jgi:integrase
VLSAEGIRFFEHETRGKLPKAPIFTENGEQSWCRHIWARQFRAAADKMNEEARGKTRIPSGATAYSFRHARIRELLQIPGNHPLAVAAQTGTSLAMTEKAYLRLIPIAMREKLAAVVESA